MNGLRDALASGNYLQVYDHRQNRWLSPDEAVAALRATDVLSATCAHEYIGHGFCGLRPEDHKTEIIGGNHRYQPPRATDVPSDGLRAAVLEAEWMDPAGGSLGRCPACHVYRANGTGHSPYCWFAPIAALAALSDPAT